MVHHNLNAEFTGSSWKRWNPHIHAPGTLLNDQYKDDWEGYLGRLESAIPTIQALGITDYFSIEGYRQVVARKKQGRLPNVGLIFSNIEMRLDIKTEKAKGINIHLLFYDLRADARGDRHALPCGSGVSLSWPHAGSCGTAALCETCGAEQRSSGLDGVRYAADGAFAPISDTACAATEGWIDLNAYRGKHGATVPDIHIPRWASRITLKVTRGRVEPLQDISEEDARAEGVTSSMDCRGGTAFPTPFRERALGTPIDLCDKLNDARGYPQRLSALRRAMP